MYIIYPDTNAIHGDHYWRGPKFEILRSLGIEYANVEVWISPVVSAELARQRQRDLDKLKKAASDQARQFRDLTGDTTIDTLLAELQTHVDQTSKEVSERYFAEPWLSVRGWPNVSTQRLVERDLGPVRPFAHIDPNAKRPESKGLRDAIIWEGLLAALDDEPDATFVFVTEDGAAFVDRSDKANPRLAPELVAEIEARGYRRDQVSWVPNVVGAQRFLEPLLEHDGKPRDFVAFGLIVEWAEERSMDDLVGHWNSQIEEMTGLDLDFDIGVPTEGGFEDWHLEVHSAATTPAAPNATWDLLATVDFKALVFKADYYTSSDAEASEYVLLGERNDHYFEIAVTRELSIRVLVDTSSNVGEKVEVVQAYVMPIG